MPIIKSAKKRMRQERKRTAVNKVKKTNLKSLIKKVRIEKSAENLSGVFSALDKAVKTHLIHKNKSARLKSRLSKNTSVPITTRPSSRGKLTKKVTKKKVSKKAN